MNRIIGIKSNKPPFPSVCDWCRETILIIEQPFSDQQIVCGDCINEEANQLAESLDDAEKTISDLNSATPI